jgi:hypothetical protein
MGSFISLLKPCKLNASRIRGYLEGGDPLLSPPFPTTKRGGGDRASREKALLFTSVLQPKKASKMITATGKMYYLVKFKKGRRSLGIRE